MSVDSLPAARARGLSGSVVSKDGRNHHARNLDRQFIFWDGEGINHDGEGLPQSYVLFGASCGHMVKAYRLKTLQCFKIMLECAASHKNAIHVGFSFKYDSEMILVDLSVRHWEILRKKNKVKWHGYTIEYFPGKWLKVSKGVRDDRESILINDVFGFFQTSFVKALKTWMPENELDDVGRIESGKQQRGDFVYDNLDTEIVPYWKAELRLGVKLMNRLRELLIEAKVCPERWHGAGAIATYIYKHSDTREKMSRLAKYRDPKIPGDLPSGVYNASRIAYAGGRFELFRLGHHPNQVWQYDINSAYPAAIAELPNLASGEWFYKRKPKYDPDLFAIWEIEFDILKGNPAANKLLIKPPPMPFFRRDHMGRVFFPYRVRTWVWTPEAKFAMMLDKSTRIISAWIYADDGERPFEFVRKMYDQRQEWKTSGNPAQMALKLALNSLYGKMAQRIGFDEDKNRLPPFYQLEWAGFVTSSTRAKLYDAMIKAGLDNVIACETDAIFTTVPVNLPIGNNLGAWSEESYSSITYLQSGTYFADDKAKYRGLDPKTLTHGDALNWLKKQDWEAPIKTTTTRFIGAGRGLGKPIHRAWLTEPREVVPGRKGKRIHSPKICPECLAGLSPTKVMHTQIISDMHGGNSAPHRLPWELNDFRDMMRAEKYDAEYD